VGPWVGGGAVAVRGVVLVVGGLAAPLLQFLVLGDTPTLEAVLRITTWKSRPLYP